MKSIIKTWAVGILTVASIVVMLCLLFTNVKLFGTIILSVICIVGAYPVGKYVLELVSEIKEDITKN